MFNFAVAISLFQDGKKVTALYTVWDVNSSEIAVAQAWAHHVNTENARHFRIEDVCQRRLLADESGYIYAWYFANGQIGVGFISDSQPEARAGIDVLESCIRELIGEGAAFDRGLIKRYNP